MLSSAAAAVNLENCDREPIHIPGHVQSHGVLLAFCPDAVVRWASSNAATVLRVAVPAVGEKLAAVHFDGDPAVHLAIGAELGATPEPGTLPRQHDVVAGGRNFHLLLHHANDLLVAELEPRPADDSGEAVFAPRAHRGIDRLRRGRTVDELLQSAAEEVRRLTGFDRVLAYRFRHDASGDIVAEDRHAALESLLHRRYPASDIPAQARRLYVENTLRLIADVRSAPVPVEGREAAPLDMSHCVLRSVSPVHIEYLSNMGVGASMSVSIVIGGQLWGMLACHHLTARHVPYHVRMACDVLAQVLAARVQSLLADAHLGRVAAAASLRSRLVQRLVVSDDGLSALSPHAAELATAFDAGAVVLAEGGRIAIHGSVAEPAARALAQWLQSGAGPVDGGMLALHTRTELPPELATALGSWVGVMALRYDEVAAAWLVVLRQEQVETIAWGGRPEKHVVPGPLGPRLTPRGSFALWRQEVRGTAVPWDGTDREIARQLLDELGRAAGARQAELQRARNQLLAVLGHDLRNPLQTIAMTPHLLQRGADSAKVGERIHNATSRMQRLIGQVLDMSRLQSGLGLGFNFVLRDLVPLVESLVDETVTAYPGSVVEARLPATLEAEVDPDRFGQLLVNLLSNARHHGEAGQPVAVELQAEGPDAVLTVRNHAAPIAPELASQLFAPYKRNSLTNPQNKGGLGLGLYIAQQITLGHGGALTYRYEAPCVVFMARLPRAR